jgi:hypothetical protein
MTASNTNIKKEIIVDFNNENGVEKMTPATHQTVANRAEKMTSGIAMNLEQFSTLKPHLTASISPAMSEHEFSRLKEDIAKNGMQESIVLCNGVIIDGRNRHKAVVELVDAGILDLGDVSFREMPSGITPLNFILSMNMHRKHYNESQRALCAARMLPFFEKEAEQNQKAGKKVGANKQQGRCNDLVGKLVNVSGRSVATAKKLQGSECESIVALVETGVMRLSVANQLLVFFEGNMPGLESALKETEKDIELKVNSKFDQKMKNIKKVIAEVAKEMGINPQVLYQPKEDGITAACHDRKVGTKGTKISKKTAKELKLIKKLGTLQRKEHDLLQTIQQTVADYRTKNFSQIVKCKCSGEKEYAIILTMEFRDGEFNPSFKVFPATTAENLGLVMETLGSKEEAEDYLQNHAGDLEGVKEVLVPFNESLKVAAEQLSALQKNASTSVAEETEAEQPLENTLPKAS